MTARKGTRGVLSGLSRLDGPKKSKKKTSWPKKILLGTLVGIFLVVVVGFIVLSAMTLVNPKYGAADREAVCVLDQLDEHPKGYLPEVVAVGKAKIENRAVDLLFTAANRTGVAKGAKVAVRYTYYPLTSRVEVHDVKLAP